MKKTYSDLTFLLLNTPGSEGDSYDVWVDLEGRHFTVEHLNNQWEYLGQAIEGDLRRTRVDQLRQGLEELGLLDWPRKEEAEDTKTWPVTYSFQEDLDYFAMGPLDQPQALGQLHRLLEDILSVTFGLREE